MGTIRVSVEGSWRDLRMDKRAGRSSNISPFVLSRLMS